MGPLTPFDGGRNLTFCTLPQVCRLQVGPMQDVRLVQDGVAAAPDPPDLVSMAPSITVRHPVELVQA